MTEAALAEIEKDIVHLKHEYEAAQKELAQCRHEISVIDVEVQQSFYVTETLIRLACVDQRLASLPRDRCRRGYNRRRRHEQLPQGSVHSEIRSVGSRRVHDERSRRRDVRTRERIETNALQSHRHRRTSTRGTLADEFVSQTRSSVS